MAYLKHAAHGLVTQGNGFGLAAENPEPRGGSGLSIALVVWLAGFLVLLVAIFWDLIAALFVRT